MRRRGERGLSLIEIMLSLAIVALMVGGATMGFRSLVKSELRGTAGRLAAAIRYSYDRAISTGAYYRLHFDLDDQSYKLERAEGRVVLARDKEQAGRGGQGLDQDKVAADEEKDLERRHGTGGLPPDLLPPPSPKRARFELFKDATVPAVKLKKVRVLDLYTPRQPDAYVKGHAYLHFFPDGHTERAVIHLGTDPADDDQYTLVVHGLTGRVEVKPGRVEAAAEFDYDDTGEKKVER
jgi:prepilin-type N-terminal cleavage/methylation domain-containing protein